MAGGEPYPTPIHGTPKFDDFTEIENPVDFEKLRGDSPLFSDKGEGRFFFQRDGVSYHFVDRWSGLTSYAEIQALAELGLYGENVCQSLQNAFNTANNEIAYASSKARWPQIVGQHCWKLLGDVDSDVPPYLAKDSYPVIRQRNGFPEISPMWLQKMGFNSMSEAQDFCSTGYLDRDDQQDSASTGFESSFHYYLASVLSAVESEKAEEKITISAPIISTLVKWGLGNLEQAEFLHGKDFTDIESAHFALKHELDSQAEIDEFQALGAINAEDYERLRSAVSGDWKSADDFRKASEISDEMIAEDYYLWLEAQDDWPLPPYKWDRTSIQSHQRLQHQLQGASNGEQKAWIGVTINSMRKQSPENNLLSDSWQAAVGLRESLLHQACRESFLQHKSLFKIMTANNFDYLWQAKIVAKLNDGPQDISELLVSGEMPPYPATANNQNLSPEQGSRLWDRNANLHNTILDSPTMSEVVDFIYHDQRFSNIASIDFVNRTIALK